MSEKYKVRLRKLINEKLENNFDPELFYVATMSEIISPNAMIQSYVELLKYPKEARLPLGWSTPIISEVNKYINIVFKYDLEIDPLVANKLKAHSEYYKWLQDMENFDYSKFDPLWINHYQTAAYMKKIFSIAPLRAKVRQYLKDHYHPMLSYHYTQNDL